MKSRMKPPKMKSRKSSPKMKSRKSPKMKSRKRELKKLLKQSKMEDDSDLDSLTKKLRNINLEKSDSDSRQPQRIPARTYKRRQQLVEEQNFDKLTDKFGKMGVKKTIKKTQSQPRSRNNFNVRQVLEDMDATNKQYKLNNPKK